MGGCSDGSECRTLRMYFPRAVIDGVDIDAELIARNQEANFWLFRLFAP